MNPEWLLVLAPVVGAGVFLLTALWPVEVPTDESRMADCGVPDRLRYQHHSRRSEDKVSDQTEKWDRETALSKALKWAETRDIHPTADLVLEVAEKFRAFLAGDIKEEPEPLAVKVQEPTFVLPKTSDPYVYFQFEDSPILYRADIGYGPQAPGGVERINARVESTWSPIKGPSVLDTRAKLREAFGYKVMASVDAARLLREHVKGVQFK